MSHPPAPRAIRLSRPFPSRSSCRASQHRESSRSYSSRACRSAVKVPTVSAQPTSAPAPRSDASESSEPSRSAAPVDPPEQPPQTPPLNPTQEVASETPAGPSIAFGPLQMRLGGYLGVTGIYRSTNSGGRVGTSFASTPYQDRLEGEVSEARLSAQTSRLSLRVDVDSGNPPPGFPGLVGISRWTSQAARRAPWP